MLRIWVTKFTLAQKVTGQWMPMILLSANLGNVVTFHNCLKLPFFGLKIRLLLTDLFWIRFRIRFRIRIRIRIRIRNRNVYFGSGSDPDPAKSFGSLRIRLRFRIRIRNTDFCTCLKNYNFCRFGSVGQDTLLCLWDLTEVKQSLALFLSIHVCLPFHFGIFCKQSSLIEFCQSLFVNSLYWLNFVNHFL